MNSRIGEQKGFNMPARWTKSNNKLDKSVYKGLQFELSKLGLCKLSKVIVIVQKPQGCYPE